MTFSCIHEVEDPLTTAPTDTLKVRCVSEWWLWDFIRDISSSESLSSPSDWWTAGKWCLCPQQLLALSSTALKCISEETFNQNHIKTWTKPDPVVWDFCGFWRSGLWRARPLQVYQGLFLWPHPDAAHGNAFVQTLWYFHTIFSSSHSVLEHKSLFSPWSFAYQTAHVMKRIIITVRKLLRAFEINLHKMNVKCRTQWKYGLNLWVLNCGTMFSKMHHDLGHVYLFMLVYVFD